MYPDCYFRFVNYAIPRAVAAASQIGRAVGAAPKRSQPTLLSQDLGLLCGDLARPIDDIGPSIAKVPEALYLAAVVAPEVTPDLRRLIMAEPTVEFDVHSVVLDDNVEILRAIASTPDLASAFRQAVETADLRIA